MAQNGNNWSFGKIVAVAAACGIVVLLFLLLILKFAFWGSFLWGLIVGGIVFLILWLYYGAEDAARPAVGAAPASAAGATKAAAPAATPAAAPATTAAQEADLGTADADGGAAADMPDDKDADAARADTGAGRKPAMLDGPRAGGADNLKEIKGVGPKMEQMLNQMGVYHFDQVAGWSADEVAWVDANLKGFKGRVSRDGWVEQAKILAAGGETEFSARVDKGEVY